MTKKDIILCVDDEQIILNALNKQLLRKFGSRFEYEFAESAEEAIELIDELDEAGYTIVMVISDQIMPGMAGDEFLTLFHKRFPKSMKILLTGQAALDSAMNAINKADLYRYLTKPWNESDFLLTVEKGLQQFYLQDKASVLLAEVHHRVKNNLSIISSLLQLQANIFTDESVKVPFHQSINRVNSIAKVHEIIYDSDSLSTVNIKEYLQRIIPAIQNTMQDYSKNITISLDIPEIEIDMNQTVPLGLLFNELLTNTYKYAFVGRNSGNIAIKMKCEGSKIHFVYHDDGVGLQEHTNFEHSTNLGLMLIKLQLQQLESEYSLYTDDGYRLEFSFEASSLDKSKASELV
jgi:two-component sensor histidine kinase